MIIKGEAATKFLEEMRRIENLSSESEEYKKRKAFNEECERIYREDEKRREGSDLNTIKCLRDELEAIKAALLDIQSLVSEQAEDEGLWFEAEHITEAMLQQNLRQLHACIEKYTKPCGRSSVVERHTANLEAVGSTPTTRSTETPCVCGHILDRHHINMNGNDLCLDCKCERYI